MIVLLLFHVGIMLMTSFFFFSSLILLCVDGLYFMIVLWTT